MMPPLSAERPFSRSDIAYIGDIPVSAFATHARRGHLPFFDPAAVTPELDEAKERAGWNRYSPMEAFMFVVSRQLHLGNSSFEALNYPAASKITGNLPWADIRESLAQGMFPQEYFGGYAWTLEGLSPMGGFTVFGTLYEIADKCAQRDSTVRSMSLVSLNSCLFIARERAELLGWIIDPEWQRAELL